VSHPGNKQRVLRLTIILTAVAFGLCACGGSGKSETRPGLADRLPVSPDMNILVVSFDALRANALGLYGYDKETSPNLDQFAKQALVFDNAWTAGPVTPTSFAAAFTGDQPYRVFLGWHLLPETTLAGFMHQHDRISFGLMNNVQLAPERHFGEGFDTYQGDTIGEQQVLKLGQDALRKYRNHRFFGWIHFISPHTPYVFREISSHIAPLRKDGPFPKRVPANYQVHNDAELKRARAMYDGEVFYADHLFGQLMATLKNLGLYEKTVVIVTSDHGEEFMEHGKTGHHSMYQQVVRIPLLIRHPGHPQGSRTDIRYSNIDLLPTLAALIGAVPPDGLDGRNLLQPIDSDRMRLSTAMTDNKAFGMLAEQNGQKLIQNCTPEFSEELYDLNNDPAESHNRILDDPQLAGKLADHMMAITQTQPCELIVASNRGKAPEDLLSPAQIEKLKSLGYIQ